MSSQVPHQDNRTITIKVPQRLDLQKFKSTTDIPRPPTEHRVIDDSSESLYKKVKLRLGSDQLLHSTVPTAYYEPLESQTEKSPSSLQRSRHRAAIRSVIKKTDHKSDNSNEKFRTRVSFDTVNLQYSDANAMDSRSDDEDEYNYISTARNAQLLGGWTDTLDSSRRGRSLSKASAGGRNSSPLAMSPSHSPMRASPQRRIHSPAPLSRGGPGLFGGFRRDYPTSPIIEHDSCTLTKIHKDWELLYAGKLPNKKPALPNRVILVYASGRRHTWVAIDWCLRSLLQDGDEVVIAAAVNPDHHIPNRLHKRHNVSKTGPQYIKVVTGNLMKYIISVLNPRKIVKISVELAVGSTKEVLRDMLQLYQPNLAVISALPNKISALRSWKSSRLTDRMVKNYPIPTIIVPAANMDDFENILFENLNRIYDEKAKHNVKEVDLKDRFYDIQLPTSQQFELALKNIRRRDLRELKDVDSVSAVSVSGKLEDGVEKKESPESSEDANEEDLEYDNEEPKEYDVTQAGRTGRRNEPHGERMVRPKSEDHSSDSDSIYSNSSLEETTNIEHMRAVVYETEANLVEQLYEIRKKPINKDTFKELLATVSTAGYKIGKEMAETARMGGEGAELVRTVTGAPSVGSGAFQAKSMLLDVSPKNTNSTTVAKQNPSPPVFKIGSNSSSNHSQMPIITKNGPSSIYSSEDKTAEGRSKGHWSTRSESGAESSTDKKKSRRFSIRRLWGK
ncbi:BA75_02651T0 [Komagataella pastoris]|uniref:BA75_02651T0 n=1 Tax=Komagataella pastoris TaxID=4922 RepID=A0A1B2JE44_PICPA|nr:BA75_02651T0 [Komagataella pastoris]